MIRNTLHLCLKCAFALEQREMFLRSFKLGVRFMLEITDETDFSSVSV